LLLSALVLVGALAANAQERIRLDCQLDSGPWQPCAMHRSTDGYQWRLELAQQSFLFRHDGRGAVTMRLGQQPWRRVEPYWRTDASLCWNGLCAKGQIPLD